MNGKIERVALYGGSFDPPHKGHIEILKRLCGDFDRVIAIPGFISPFKQQARTANATDRLNMLRAAISEENIPAEVSSYEIDKGGVSYTYETISHFMANGQNTKDRRQLYFVIGSESLATLHLWRNADFLKENVIFYVIPRENYVLCLTETGVFFEKTTETIQKSHKSDVDVCTKEINLAYSNLVSKADDSKFFKIEVAPYTIKDYSSSLFKAAHAFGRSRQMVSETVYDYIKSHRLYNDYKYLTQGFTVFGLDENRIQHTFGAVKAGIILAKLHGESVNKTIISLILHDIGKNASPQTLALTNVTISDMDGVIEPCRHAIVGADIAMQYFKIDDTDILDAIRYHTTGRPAMSRLEKITALADYIEENRSFAGRQEIFESAKKDLDRAMAEMLTSIIAHLKGAGKEICDISLKALYFYNDLVYTSY